MIDAIRLNLSDLGADPAPLKLLLLVTDGRDFADPKGDEPGDFAALGGALRRAGITVLVARFRPEADAEQASTNLRDLSEATGGFLGPRDQPDELENVLESLGQSVADLQRVEIPTPWSWRFTAGSRRVAVRFNTAGGQPLLADVGTLAGGSGLPRTIGVVLVGLSVVLLLFLGLSKLRGTGRPSRDDDGPDVDAIVAAAHNLIRRGASAERAVEELTRGNPEAAQVLTNLDEALLSDPRFPYLRTRPGRKRIQEIRELLRKRQGDRRGLPDTLARELAAAVTEGLAPAAAAYKLCALTSLEERAAFIALESRTARRVAPRRRAGLPRPGNAARPWRRGGDSGCPRVRREPGRGRLRRLAGGGGRSGPPGGDPPPRRGANHRRSRDGVRDPARQRSVGRAGARHDLGGERRVLHRADRGRGQGRRAKRSARSEPWSTARQSRSGAGNTSSSRRACSA